MIIGRDEKHCMYIHWEREGGRGNVCICNSQLDSQLKPMVCSDDLECFILLRSCNVWNSVRKDLKKLFYDIRKISPIFINFASMEEGRTCTEYSVVVFISCFQYIPSYYFLVLSFFTLVLLFTYFFLCDLFFLVFFLPFSHPCLSRVYCWLFFYFSLSSSSVSMKIYANMQSTYAH